MTTQRPPSTEAETRARIVRHLNTDHRSSLSDYCRHYAAVPPNLAKTAELSDITLEGMTLNVGEIGKPVFVPFDPPMKDYSESRGRLKDMAVEASEALGKSIYTINNYTPPGIGGVVVSVLVVWGMVVFSDPRFLAEGSFVREIAFLGYSPVVDALEKVRLPLWFIIMGIHIVEAGLLVRKLAKHNVETFSGVWWKWAGNGFFEGIGCLFRFDREVERVQKAGSAGAPKGLH